MLLPVAPDGGEHHATLRLPQRLGSHLRLPVLVRQERIGDEFALEDLGLEPTPAADLVEDVLLRDAHGVELGQVPPQLVEVPVGGLALLGGRVHDVPDGVLHEAAHPVLQVLPSRMERRSV